MLVSRKWSRRQEISSVKIQGPILSVKTSQFRRHVDKYNSHREGQGVQGLRPLARGSVTPPGKPTRSAEMLAEGEGDLGWVVEKGNYEC